MTEQPHPDPGGEAAARVAQLAAMTISVGEALARLRAQRLHNQAADDQREAAATRSAARAYAAESAVIYRQALSQEWIRTSPTDDLLGAWRCAEPYRSTDPTARIATDRIEERLRQLHPEAMVVFDSPDLRDWPAQDRFQQCVSFMRGPYGVDPVGTPITMPDRTSDPSAAPDHSPPTHHPGPPTDQRISVGNAPIRSSDVVAQAFPVSIHDAMRTAPKAATDAVRAITAGPIRKQLTAAPHPPTRQPAGSSR